MAALSLVGGLVLVAPGVAHAQNATLTCTAADSGSQVLLDQIGGSVAIPMSITPSVPDSMASGTSESVGFSWTLDPGPTLTDLAIGAGIISLDVTLDLKVNPAGGSGGPYPFQPASTSVGINPPTQPTLQAQGSVTAASSTIQYTLQGGRVDIVAHLANGDLLINMNCDAGGAVLASTTIGAASGGGGTVATTAPPTNAGNANALYTG